VEAVSLFEQGMGALQRHDYRGAAGVFRQIIDTFPNEGGLLDRSSVYLSLCDRELRRAPVSLRTVEERLTAATAALNNGQDEEARRLTRGVLDEAPDHDLALYLLAAIEARRGATQSALGLLARALEVNPEIRAQARHDADFDDLQDLDAFRQLIELPADRRGGAWRRTRRGRPER
jgi:tetratricopeptide (TPR) repeat protein